ncbi:circadian locomoter output cycles protein kaput-like [Penaeus monodon]|uniref:circadian locomoter output cycles protein kaput-like n=1 Tax=Penaeus monodon TaxID=6687 RepID=UPI0018A7D008|nr:circadian locomoter output cycles protein kaput-like [Penaeus monodon]
MRNIAEKMRRDKLNNYVTELASIVPLVSGANKRVDKTSVLRLAANFIRIHKILKIDGEFSWSWIRHSKSLSQNYYLFFNIAVYLPQAIGGFLMVVTSTGKVLYVSEAMEEIFGHSQVELLGRSIYHVIHPEDYDIIQEQLNSKDTSRRSFFCRMMEKALSRNDPSRYEIVHIVGSIRMLLQPTGHDQAADPARDSCDKSLSDGEDRMGSDSDGDDAQSAPAVNKVGTHLLVAFVRVVKDRPITELSLVESTQDEYITRHSMDGKILYTDHRISFVTGLMPQEVLGTSAFHYMHPDDLVWSIVAHKLMFNSSQGQGMVSYRLRCKGSKFVTLRSRGYIESNKQTGQAETFVCINTVVSSKETENEIKSQRRKLLPMVTTPQGDNHLTTVSSAMPPELLSAMKKMLDPQYVKKLFDSIDDMGFEVSMEAKMTATKPDWKEEEEEKASVPGTNNRSTDQEVSAEFGASKNSKKRALEGTLSPQPKKFCTSEFFRGQEVLHSTNSISEQNQSFRQSNFSHSSSPVYGSHSSSLLASPQNMVCDMSPARAKQGPALRSYYDSVLPQPPHSSEGGGPVRGHLHPELRKGFHHDHNAQNTSTNQGKDCHGGGGIPNKTENQAGDAALSNQGFQNNPKCVESPRSYRQSEANSSPMYPSITAQNPHFPQNSPSLIHSPQVRTFPQGEQSVVPLFPHTNQADQNFRFSSRMEVLISSQRQQQQYMQQSERQQLQLKQQSLKQQDAAQNHQDQYRQHSQQNQQTQQLNYQVHINCQQSVQNYQPGRSYQQTRQLQEQHQKTGHQFQPGAIYQQSIQTEHSVQPQQSELHLKQLGLCQQPEMQHQPRQHQQQDMHHQQLRQHNQLELQPQHSRHEQSEQQYQQTRHHPSDPHHQQKRNQHHLHQQQSGQIQYMSHQAQNRPQTQLNANVRGQAFPSGQIQQNPSLQQWHSSSAFCHTQNQNGNYGLYDPLSIASSSGMHNPGSTTIQTKSSGPQF